MKLLYLNYRFADEVLDSPTYKTLKKDIIDILSKAPSIQLANPKYRKRSNRYFTTDQTAINLYLDKQFGNRKWEVHPFVIPEDKNAAKGKQKRGKNTKLLADYRKGRVQIEVQFGNMARWYTDIFKFQLSYSLGHIDVGVLCVPTLAYSKTIDENVANYERVCRELPFAKMSITLPILVIGLEP